VSSSSHFLSWWSCYESCRGWHLAPHSRQPSNHYSTHNSLKHPTPNTRAQHSKINTPHSYPHRREMDSYFKDHRKIFESPHTSAKKQAVFKKLTALVVDWTVSLSPVKRIPVEFLTPQMRVFGSTRLGVGSNDSGSLSISPPLFSSASKCVCLPPCFYVAFQSLILLHFQITRHRRPVHHHVLHQRA
jgi:hypothetical protein